MQALQLRDDSTDVHAEGSVGLAASPCVAPRPAMGGIAHLAGGRWVLFGSARIQPRAATQPTKAQRMARRSHPVASGSRKKGDLSGAHHALRQIWWTRARVPFALVLGWHSPQGVLVTTRKQTGLAASMRAIRPPVSEARCAARLSPIMHRAWAWVNGCLDGIRRRPSDSASRVYSILTHDAPIDRGVVLRRVDLAEVILGHQLATAGSSRSRSPRRTRWDRRTMTAAALWSSR